MNAFIHSFIHSHIHSFIHACMHSILTEDRLPTPVFLGFPCGSAGKESTCNAGDPASVSGLGRSPGEGKGHPLQYFGLENSMHYTGLQRVRHGVAKSQTRLSDFHFPFHPTSPFFRSFFFNIKKNECWKQSRYFKQMKNLSKFIAETPLSKQTPGKRSLETNSSCHHVWASLPHPHFPHFFLVPFVLKPTALVV